MIASHLLKNPEVQEAIDRELKGILDELHVDATTVVARILQAIRAAEWAGTGAWQLATRLLGWELLGKYLGRFHDRLDVSLGEQIMERLNRGRLRAAGQRVDDDEPEEPKPRDKR